MRKISTQLSTGLAHEPKFFTVRAYTFGYVHDLSHGNGLDFGPGTQFTINARPDTFDRYYGDDLGYAFQFSLRIRYHSTLTARLSTRRTSPEW